MSNKILKIGKKCDERCINNIMECIIEDTIKQYSVKDYLNILDDIFYKFNCISYIGKNNIVIHDETIYLNKYFNCEKSYEGIVLFNKKYKIKYIPEIFGFSDEILISIENIFNLYKELKKYLEDTNDRISNSLWNKLKTIKYNEYSKKEVCDKNLFSNNSEINLYNFNKSNVLNGIDENNIEYPKIENINNSNINAIMNLNIENIDNLKVENILNSKIKNISNSDIESLKNSIINNSFLINIEYLNKSEIKKLESAYINQVRGLKSAEVNNLVTNIMQKSTIDCISNSKIKFLCNCEIKKMKNTEILIIYNSKINNKLFSNFYIGRNEKIEDKFLNIDEFIYASYKLNIKVSEMNFSLTNLNMIFNEAFKICNKYEYAMFKYINFFSENDGKEFHKIYLKNINNNKDNFFKFNYINYLKSLLLNYSKYSHSEYLLWYSIHKKNLEIINFISYYYMCKNCEDIYANLAGSELNNINISSQSNLNDIELIKKISKKLQINVLSYIKYKYSYCGDRSNGNPYLTLIYRNDLKDNHYKI